MNPRTSVTHPPSRDGRATLASVLSLASVPPFLAAASLAWANFDSSLAMIRYGAARAFLLPFTMCLLASIVPSALGFFLGWKCAIQRHDRTPLRSWVGFIVGGFVLTLNVILVLAFYKLRFEIPTGNG